MRVSISTIKLYSWEINPGKNSHFYHKSQKRKKESATMTFKNRNGWKMIKPKYFIISDLKKKYFPFKTSTIEKNSFLNRCRSNLKYATLAVCLLNWIIVDHPIVALIDFYRLNICLNFRADVNRYFWRTRIRKTRHTRIVTLWMKKFPKSYKST